MTDINYEDFTKIDMRTGRIVKVEEFPEAKKPMYKIQVDFGEEIGTKWTAAQATQAYSKEDLLDRQVDAVVNFTPKNIAGFLSEILLLGVEDKEGGLVLLKPDREAKIGSRVY